MSLISLNLVTDKNSLVGIMKKSLLFLQSDSLGIDVDKLLQSNIEFLMSNGIIEIQNDKYTLKSFGKAAVNGMEVWFFKFFYFKYIYWCCFKSQVFLGNISFEVARELFEDLTYAQNSLVLVNDLHLLYLITPYSVLEEINPSSDVLWNVVRLLAF